MSNSWYKRVAAGLTIVAVMELIVVWELAWHDTYAKWDVRDARIAVRRIDNNRYTALHGTSEEAIVCLRDIVTCYTPWTWKRPDLLLGQFVQERRANAVRDVVDYLRIKTGKDFGNDPEKWIEALNTETPASKTQ